MLISELPSIQTRQINAFKKKGINTVDDLARMVPKKYIDYRKIKNIHDCVDGSYAAIRGKLIALEKRPLKGTNREYIYIKIVQDDGTVVTGMMFNNVYKFDQYLELYNTSVTLCGRVSISPIYGYTIQNPEELKGTDAFRPYIKRVYPKIKGISEKTMTDLIFEALAETKDPLEKSIVQQESLPEYRDSLYGLHYPKNEQDILNGTKRLVYNDMFFFALSLLQDQINKMDTDKLMTNMSLLNEFVKGLPFQLTKDQHSSITEMLNNAKSGKRNNVLLQGDVGCGKTIVAASMMILATGNGYQSVLMAPRTVLATQHYEEIKGYAEKVGKTCVFLHSKLKAKEKKKILQQIKSGEADMIVGTHSCFAKDVEYKNLAVIITDEEHLFGVAQKEAIKNKAEDGVHVISMSATPIPRTLSDVVYGETKEIISIKEKPAGRKEIITSIKENSEKVFQDMYREIMQGHKCYVVCPAIEENEDYQIACVDAVEKKYRKYFSRYGIKAGTLNGKMKSEEIKDTINQFLNNEIQILISTTVVEVGVNVPDATVMIIEQAERFGLASLHQLRGRVGRSSLQSYCYLISEDQYNERLVAMTKTNDGFQIAEADLLQRGGGDLIGTQQSGFNKYLMEVMKHRHLFQHIRQVAEWADAQGYGRKLLELYQESQEEKAKNRTKKENKQAKN